MSGKGWETLQTLLFSLPTTHERLTEYPILKIKKPRLKEGKNVPKVTQAMHHNVQTVLFISQMALGPSTQIHHRDSLWNSFGSCKPLLQETVPEDSCRHPQILP